MGNKLFVLVGESGSGKSTIEKIIADDLNLATRAISSTTRDPRTNEVNGVDYNFISEEKFFEGIKNRNFLEYTEYTLEHRIVFYGLNKNDIDLNKDNYICVVNPRGLRQLKNSIWKDNIVSIHIKRDDRTRVISSLMRDNSNFKQVLREACRRYEADLKDFQDIIQEVNYTVLNNSSLEEAVQAIEKIINFEKHK